MKKILILLFAFIAFNSQAQNPLVGKPSLKLVFDVAQTKKWDFTVDTNNILEINGTGGTPSIRFTDFAGTGNRILAVDADGDLIRTTVDPALTTVAGSNTQVQYNNSGAFGASSDFVFDGTNLGVNGIFPVSTSSGLALRNNAGTAVATIGVGSTSSTNSTWTGNTVVTGDWDVSGFVEGGNLRITSNTLSSQDVNGNIVYSPNGTGINQFTKNVAPSTNGTLALGGSSTRWDDIYLAGEIFMINSGGISITPAVQGGNRTYTIPDAGSSTSFMMGASGAANRIPYFSGTSILTNSADFTYDGASLGIRNTTNQLVLGVTNTTTINSTAPAASRVYTIPDFGSDDTFTGIAATQTLTNKTLTSPVINRVVGISANTNYEQKLVKNVNVTDNSATSVLVLTLPSGSNMAGSYIVEITALISDITGTDGTNTQSSSKFYKGYINYSQGATANGGTIIEVETIESTSSASTAGTKDIGAVSFATAKSGTDNSIHTVSFTINSTGTGESNLRCVFSFEIMARGFTSFSAN